MLRTSRILSAAVVAAALAVPLGVMPAAQAAGSAGPGPAARTASAPASARPTMTVDGVALTVTNPGMPDGAAFAASTSGSAEAVDIGLLVGWYAGLEDIGHVGEVHATSDDVGGN